MTIQKDIEQAKKRLIKQAKGHGIVENFGQKEVRELKEKHIDISLYTEEENAKRRAIDRFDEWCGTYNGID